MSITETTEVVRDTIQVVLVRWQLDSGVVSAARRYTVGGAHHAWGQRSGHIICKIKALDRKFYNGLNFICEWPFDRETLQMDQ